MKKPFVFISYSTKESDIANLVHSYLEGNGIHCWIASRNIEGGESFAEQIVLAIRDCCAFVMIASPNSDSSPHVSNELSLALGNKKKIIPLRVSDYQLSAASEYYLQQAQWIDASKDMNEALRHLIKAVRPTLPETEATASAVSEVIVPAQTKQKKDENEAKDDLPEFSREEIVELLLSKIEKFPYCLKDKATTKDAYTRLKASARILFDQTLSMYYKGKPTAGGLDYVDLIVDSLSQGQGVCQKIVGLPGCAKNMLIQLAYYKMLESFRKEESNYLPIYLSSSYYEKIPYAKGAAREEMTALVKEETKEFFSFLRKNPTVRPVLMLEAVREHVVADFAPEDVILDVFQPFGRFNRIVSVDVGLIKNKLRHKRIIPLLGDTSGYTFRFRSLSIYNKDACLTAIQAILTIYREQYDGVEPSDVYKALYRLRFATADIFIIRLVAAELAQGHSVNDISLVDIYERLALNELRGDEGKMLEIAKELYEYVYNEKHSVKSHGYNAALWSLPHKHNTYLEFLIAYYFCYCIQNADTCKDFGVLKISMTTMENHFVYARIQENYLLQETLLKLVSKSYHTLDVVQKSNVTYWLGKIDYAELSESAQAFLDKEFLRLKPLVESDNQQTLANRYNQFLFRSVCNGLISCGRTNVLDEYLCLVITNDVANAINRGATIRYMGGASQNSCHTDFSLDTDYQLGEQAIRILCSRVDELLRSKKAGYVEPDLVSLLTLLQSRMQVTPEKLSYNLTPYCEKCIELLKEYQKRPRSVVSDRILYYFKSIGEDMEIYVEKSRQDAAFTVFSELSKMKSTKRIQWLNYGIEDPESVAEHTFNAWVLAMIYLPLEHSAQNYSKQTILDMLLIHDMAEAILGDCPIQLSEPTKELKAQNVVLRKLFMKGTYPDVANMTHYYDVWADYYQGQSINSRVARDVNLIQTVNTFFECFIENPNKFDLSTVNEWKAKGEALSTDIGYALFDRIILRNPLYRKAVDKLITESAKKELKITRE